MFSETSAAATYCGIMKPELSPSSRATRNGGSPSERLGLTSRSTRRSQMFASSAHAIARQSSAIATGCPWKLPFETISSSSETRTSGLSVAALSSTATVRFRVVEQVAAGAVHLRRTAQRVRVLHLVAPAVRLDDRRARRAARRMCGGARAWPGSGRASWIAGWKLVGVPWSASSDIGTGDVRGARRAARARTSASAAIAVMNCVPLMSESPSFAASSIGSSPTAASASAARKQRAVDGRLSLADERQREVRERREVAARADRAARRHARHARPR